MQPERVGGRERERERDRDREFKINCQHCWSILAPVVGDLLVPQTAFRAAYTKTITNIHSPNSENMLTYS